MWRRVVYRIFKRCLDFALSCIALVVLSPLIIGLFALIRLKLGSPAFFLQTRAGRGGALFKIIKFKSMSSETDENGKPLPDEQRLGGFGRWLRESSLDELPSFFNVLTGELSLVGPRPLLPEYLPLYSPEQSRRHDVRPGITGWTQVNGRNSLSWEDKFELDIWYVDNQSFWLDIKILSLTVIRVLRKQDINADGHASMPPFTGSDS